MYKKLKKQNGEKFAQDIRNFHNGLLEIPDLDVILRHAGRDATPLLPYLMSLLSTNDDTPPSPAPEDPFVLLDRAGYKAFYADTLEKQNSIKPYFAAGELLCTFNDHARHKDYHIVHAVRKDAGQIKRGDYKGKEERQDAYGTSVISIQMRKKGGFISIKNRYNHAVAHCDNTFNSNPDNIIEGLSASLRKHFNVDFTTPESPLPEGYVLMGDQVFKYHEEHNNIYYGDQAWARFCTIHEIDIVAGDALFDGFLFDNKTKTLKSIKPLSMDSFAKDFNRCYGGNKGLSVQKGNLTLNGEVLIGAENSRIKTLCLPELTAMSDGCLRDARALTQFHAPALISMGYQCLLYAPALTQFHAPALISMSDGCLPDARALTQFHAPGLITMGNGCLYDTRALTQFEAPALTAMGYNCLREARALTQFHAPALISMGSYCLREAPALTQFHAPALTTKGNGCLTLSKKLEKTAGKKQISSGPRLSGYQGP